MNRTFFCALLLACAALNVFAITPVTPDHDLRTAAVFAMGGTGYAGVMSSGERALRQVVKAPDAAARLQSMLAASTPAGQLYALLGLRARDRAAYDRAREKLSDNDTEVKTMSGCIIHPQTFRELLRQIDDGRFDELLAREWPDQKR
jgi:hypothetical protein